MMNKAVRARTIMSSPCVIDALPRLDTNQQRALTADQVERLASAIEPPYDVLVLVLAFTGIRYGEAVALRRGRCNLLRNRLVIAESMAEVNGSIHFGPPKTHQQRVVVFPKFLAARLETHLDERVEADPSSFVFAAPLGGRSSWSTATARS